MCHLLFPAPPEAPSCPLFFLISFFAPISVQQSVTASRRASKPGSQLSFQPAGLPALSSLSGQQTVEERASLSKLMARALLPGLKMNWNVVYLKHTRPPPGRKITQHKNSGPSLRVIFYPGGETCCGKTISLITLPLSFDLPPFCCLVFVLFWEETRQKQSHVSQAMDSSLRMGFTVVSSSLAIVKKINLVKSKQQPEEEVRKATLGCQRDTTSSK